SYIRQQLAHGQAAIAKTPQPRHLAPEIGRMHSQSAIRRTFRRGLAYLVVHEYRYHVRDYIDAAELRTKWYACIYAFWVFSINSASENSCCTRLRAEHPMADRASGLASMSCR